MSKRHQHQEASVEQTEDETVVTEEQGEAMPVETSETPAETVTETPKAPKRGVGTVACEALQAGKTNQETLDAVKAEFPEANTTMAAINWYRNDLRKKGQDVPTARSLSADSNAAAKAERLAAKEAAKAEAKAKREAEKAAAKAAKAQTVTTSEEAAQVEETVGDEDFLA